MNRLKALGIGLIFTLASVTAACTPTAAGPAWTFTPAAAGASQAPSTTGQPGSQGGVLGTIELGAIDIGAAFDDIHRGELRESDKAAERDRA